MEPTLKQKNILKKLYEENLISEKQYKSALNSKKFAIEIISFGIELKNKRIKASYKRCYGTSLKRVKEVMRVQGVYKTNYNGKDITRW